MVRDEFLASAVMAAEVLKHKLEKRLRLGAIPSNVDKIVTPGFSNVGLWSHWKCRIRNHQGRISWKGLAAFIPPDELYPMFRNHFTGMAIRVEHPVAGLCSRAAEGEKAGKGREFRSSSRTVIVSDQFAAYIRPLGGSRNVWVNAELRIDRAEPSGRRFYTGPDLDEILQKRSSGIQSSRKMRLSCLVDPFEFGQRLATNSGLAMLEHSMTGLVVSIGKAKSIHACVPIARLVDVTREAATFVLDRFVESFNPGAK